MNVNEILPGFKCLLNSVCTKIAIIYMYNYWWYLFHWTICIDQWWGQFILTTCIWIGKVRKITVLLFSRREKTVSLDDHEAVEVISSKLSKMEQKLLDLNRYWSEMEKTKMPPASVQYGESRKRQPTRTKTFSGYDTNRNKSQPSQKRQRRSTSDLGGPPRAPERAVRTREKPKPPERSGSLHHNVRPPVREGLVTRASSRPINAGMTQSLPRNYRPSSPESLKQQLEEVRNSIAIGTLEIYDQEPSLLP